MFDNSDDYDFSISGSSKLSSLFESSEFSNESNSSLKYSAPKQPKAKKDVDVNDSSKIKLQTTVVLAKVVTLWKLENTDYKSFGKHGLAIIGSTDLNLFEVIAYKEKNNIKLRTNINSSCSFYNQKDCFSSFYDNENQNWLVKFENINDQNEFCQEIKTRGASIVDSTEASSFQEKKVNSTESVLKPDVLPREIPTPKPQVLPRLSQTLEKNIDEANSDSSGSQRRANILSRMAKMGQQILPNDILKNASTDVSESELDDSKNEHKAPPRRFKRAIPLEKQLSNEETAPPRVQQSHTEHQMIPAQSSNLNPMQFPSQNMISSYPQNMMGQFPPNMLSPMLMSQAMPYDGFHQYVATQNAELKVNLAQISAKLDTVLSIGNKSDRKSEDSNLKSKIKTLELRSENLLTELERYEKKYDDLQRKCKILEDRGAESEDNKSVIDNLTKKIRTLEENLNMAKQKNSNYEELEMDLQKYKSDIREFEKTFEKQFLKLKDLEEFYEENKNNRNLQETIDALNDTVTNLKLKLKDFEDHFLKTEAEKQKRVDAQKKKSNEFSEKIKEHMNNMYQSILAGFTDDNSYSITQIKSQVAQNLKGTTFAIIKELGDVYKAEDENIFN